MYIYMKIDLQNQLADSDAILSSMKVEVVTMDFYYSGT
jgi:hypothetical protein